MSSKEQLIKEITMLFVRYVPCNELPECCIKQVEIDCKQYGGCCEVIKDAISTALTEGLK